MKFDHSHEFAAPLAAVLAMLADPRFAHERAMASGAKDADALVDNDDDGSFTVAIRRTVPADSIPAELRGLVGGALDVKYTEVWEAPEPDEVSGTFALDIAGAPGRVTGSMRAFQRADATRIEATGEALAPVPLFGPIIERAIVAAVSEGFVQEFGAGDAWLAAHT